MKFFSVLLLAAAGTAAAKGHKNSTSTNAQCRQMERLTFLEKLAANDTLLAEKTKNNATKIAEIKKKAADDKPILDKLMANQTLMTACAQRAAVKQEERQCFQMVHLQKLEKLVANDTALKAFTKNNDTKAAAIKKKVEDSKAKLATMSSNTTLTTFCAAFQEKVMCHRMARMAKLIEKEQKLIANQTALEARFKNNQTKIDAFKARVAKQQDMLKAMQANETMVKNCGMKAPLSGNASNSSKSAATAVQAFGVSASLLALVVAGLLSL